MASLFIPATISAVTMFGADTPTKISAPFSASAVYPSYLPDSSPSAFLSASSSDSQNAVDYTVNITHGDLWKTIEQQQFCNGNTC
mgnify:CR=1 FL=1